MEINTTKLEDVINSEFKTMTLHPMMEETRFAIAEIGNAQIQVVITKNEDEHCSEVVKGIATL